MRQITPAPYRLKNASDVLCCVLRPHARFAAVVGHDEVIPAASQTDHFSVVRVCYAHHCRQLCCRSQQACAEVCSGSECCNPEGAAHQLRPIFCSAARNSGMYCSGSRGDLSAHSLGAWRLLAQVGPRR